MSSFSLSSIASMLVLTAVAVAPLVGCGNSSASSGGTTGSGGSGGGASTSSTTGSTSTSSTTGGGTGGSSSGCAGFCESLLACTTPDSCVLVDAAGAQNACVGSCETAVGALTAGEKSLVDTCLACSNQASGGKCFLTEPQAACATECKAAAPTAAMKKWQAAVGMAPLDPAADCTNGENVLASQDCQSGGGGTSCTVECCNQTCGATPDVAADCTMPASGPSTCTCTAGKNKGKTFTPAGGPCSPGDLWNACNL